jgi:hypothetical protein
MMLKMPVPLLFRGLAISQPRLPRDSCAGAAGRVGPRAGGARWRALLPAGLRFFDHRTLCYLPLRHFLSREHVSTNPSV